MGWSQAKRSGRRTVTPSASRMCTKASMSCSAFRSISSGQRLPPSLLKKSHCVLSWTTAGEMVSHGGMRASSTTPTMISSSGSHSLKVLTTQPAAGVWASVDKDSLGLTGKLLRTLGRAERSQTAPDAIAGAVYRRGGAGSAGRDDQQRAGRRLEKRLHHGAVTLGEAAVPRQHDELGADRLSLLDDGRHWLPDAHAHAVTAALRALGEAHAELVLPVGPLVVLLVDDARRREAAALARRGLGDHVQHDDLAAPLAQRFVGVTHGRGRGRAAFEWDDEAPQGGKRAHARPHQQHRRREAAEERLGHMPDAGRGREIVMLHVVTK